MQYLLTITNEQGDCQEVDISLEDLDLTKPNDQKKLAKAMN